MDQFVHGFQPLAAICRAITEGNITRATQLLDEQGAEGLAGLKGGSLGQSPVMLALATGHPKLARRIVAAGYQPDLWDAAGLNMPGELHALALAAPSTLNLCNADGWAPMHLAAYAHAHDAISTLCELDADPNVLTCNSALETPLHAAVRCDDHESVRILLDAGADPRFQDGAHRTPLQLAIELASVRAGNTLTERAE